MRRRILTTAVLLAALMSLEAPIDLPAQLVAHTRESLSYVSPEGDLCEPKPGALDPPGSYQDPTGCVPSPMQCATGRYNGSWTSSVDSRFATCVGGGWHVTEYVGGTHDPLCGSLIRDDAVILGSWRDPNQTCGAFGVGSGYGIPGNRLQPAVTGRHGAVSSSAPEASDVGIAVLAGGGNAIDAAVAMVFAVGVVAPESCGIGGGGFLLYRGADGTVDALDFRETAPAGLPIDFEAKTSMWGTGHMVAGVPGTVAGMAAAQSRYGSKPLKRLVEPAIALADSGIRWSPKQADTLTVHKDRLRRYPASVEQFLVRDAVGNVQAPPPYPVAAPRVQGDLARTLRAIREGGPKAFYRGAIADMIVAEMDRSRSDGGTPTGDKGVMTADDLAQYRAVWRTPLRGTYRGREILAMPPPTAGGIVTLETLNLMEGSPLDGTIDRFPHSSADQLHLLAEAKKLSWADRNAYVADPAYVAVPTDVLISKSYADQRRASIDMTKAKSPGPGTVAGFTPAPAAGGTDGPNTHHISVVDAAGNAVAVTCTIERPFGSGVVVPGTGILLNSQLTDFDDPVKPVYPSVENPEANKNAPQAGKRPRSSMSPTIVVADGRPRLVLGGVGGSSIPMGVIAAISNVLDYGMEEGLALDVARSDAAVDEHLCCKLRIEDHRVPSEERDELARRDHTFEDVGQYDPMFQPVVQMAGMRPDQSQFAASDPRYDRGARARP